MTHLSGNLICLSTTLVSSIPNNMATSLTMSSTSGSFTSYAARGGSTRSKTRKAA